MKLPSPLAGNRRGIRRVALYALCTALVVTLQVVMAPLPNIELVSFLCILYTVALGWDALLIVYAFVLLEGLMFGIHLWWFAYLYVWTILVIIVICFRKTRSALLWAVISALFGLFFGGLCSIPYALTGGISLGLTYWVSGIPFDLVHCGSNFVLCIVLWKPAQPAVLMMTKIKQGER